MLLFTVSSYAQDLVDPSKSDIFQQSGQAESPRPKPFEAQASPPPEPEDTPLSDFVNKKEKKPSIVRAGFVFGGQYAQYDTLPYTDIYFSPYIEIGSWFLSYDIPLRFDWSNAFITEIWTKPSALISKIESRLFIEKTNSVFNYFQFDISQKDNITLGHGRIFNNYAVNLVEQYEIKKSLTLALDLDYFGINFVLDNIANPSIMGVDAYIYPLAGIKPTNPNLEIYKQLKIYATYGIDLSPYQERSEGIYDYKNNPNSPMFSMFETGVQLPLARYKHIIDFMIYGDFAITPKTQNNSLIINSGYGISGGTIITFGKIFPIRFEVSQAFGYWTPRFMNEFYNLDKIYGDTPEFTRNNKFMNLIPNQTYFTGSIGLQIIEKDTFLTLEMFGDFMARDLWFTLSLTLGKRLLKLFTMDVSWTARALGNTTFEFLDLQNSILDINLKYHMLPNMYWGVQWKFSGYIGNVFDEKVPSIGLKEYHLIGFSFTFKY